MEKIPKIQKVLPIEDTRLRVTFVNGAVKEYNCDQLFQRPEFYLLKNTIFFNNVQVDPGGYGISWNADLDLSEYELWTNGIPVEKKYEG